MDWLEAIIAFNEWYWHYLPVILAGAAIFDTIMWTIILLILWRKHHE